MPPSERPAPGPEEEHQPAQESDNRRALWTAGAGTAFVLLLRFILIRRATFCGTPDSCAYLALGQSLSRHQGFVQNFLYQYQMVDTHLPQHGIEYWRPGTSLLFLLAQPFAGVTLHSSLVLTVLAGVLLAAAAWRIARNLTGNPMLACLAYLLCLVLPPMWVNASTPDSSVFYGACVAWLLALFRVDFRSYAEDALAWACLVGVNLIRNDAVLLLVPVLVVLWLRRRTGLTRGSSLAYCAFALAAFAAASLPMRAISYAVLGHAGSSGGAEPLFFLSLSDLLYYHQAITLHTALAAGAKRLIAMRLGATATIVYRIVVLMFGFGAIFLPGVLRQGRAKKPPMWLALAAGAAFALTITAVYGLALPAIGTFSALRSANGLLPLVAVLMVAGVVGYATSCRAAYSLSALAIFFYTVTGVMEMHRTIDTMNQTGDVDRSVARYLAEHGAQPEMSTLIMTADAAQFSTTTSYPAVPIPSNGTGPTLEAVHDLHPAYLLVETDWDGKYLAQLAAALKPRSAERVPGTQIVVLTLQ